MAIPGRAGVPNTSHLVRSFESKLPSQGRGILCCATPQLQGCLLLPYTYYSFQVLEILKGHKVHTANYSNKTFPWLGISEISMVKTATNSLTLGYYLLLSH
jgi:hypothetical protein